MFRYVLKNIDDNKILSFILFLQVVIVMGLLTVTAALYEQRACEYRPVKKITSHDGFLVDLALNGGNISSSAELGEKMKRAKVISSYNISVNYQKEPGKNDEYPVLVENVHALDDEFISCFTPGMSSGKWVRAEDGRSDALYAAVLQDDEKYKTGDEVLLKMDEKGNNLKKPVKIRISGVIDPHSDIISAGDREKYNDFRLMFSSFDKISNHFINDSDIQEIGDDFYHHNFYISKKNFDSYNKNYCEKQGGSSFDYKPLRCNLGDLTAVIYEKNAGRADKEYDKNYIMENFFYEFLRDLKDVRKNSRNYVLKNVKPVFPVSLMSVVFLVFSFVTADSLVYIKQKRTYEIFYINGLSRGRCRRLHTLYLVFLILCGIFAAAVLTAAVSLFRF